VELLKLEAAVNLKEGLQRVSLHLGFEVELAKLKAKDLL